MGFGRPTPTFEVWRTALGADVYISSVLAQRQIYTARGREVYGGNTYSDVFKEFAIGSSMQIGGESGTVYFASDLLNVRAVRIKMLGGAGDATVQFLRVNGLDPFGTNLSVPDDGEFHEFEASEVGNIPANSTILYAADTLAAALVEFIE